MCAAFDDVGQPLAADVFVVVDLYGEHLTLAAADVTEVEDVARHVNTRHGDDRTQTDTQLRATGHLTDRQTDTCMLSIYAFLQDIKYICILMHH